MTPSACSAHAWFDNGAYVLWISYRLTPCLRSFVSACTSQVAHTARQGLACALLGPLWRRQRAKSLGPPALLHAVFGGVCGALLRPPPFFVFSCGDRSGGDIGHARPRRKAAKRLPPLPPPGRRHGRRVLARLLLAWAPLLFGWTRYTLVSILSLVER